MSAILHLALVACLAIVSTFAAPQASSLTSDSVRFSRLLSKQPDLLRFTSISNLGPASPVLEPKFQAVYDAQEVNQPKKSGISSETFLRRTENLGDDALLITKAEPGQEYVYIHQKIKEGGEPVIPTESLTSLNQKPSGRKPLALLRQSSGNKLNISPVFPESAHPRTKLNGNSQVSILSDISNQDEFSDVTTSNPLASSADEEAEAVTTESIQEDEIPVTTYPPRQEKRGRMIVNVVTSQPRFVIDNTTTPVPTPAVTTTTTTAVPKAKPQERPAQSSDAATSEDDENLVVDAFHRNGHFPDFEDSPAHLHTAESNQPARVNVRPASSGKDYEYEYIYYYYDDEDDDNSTSKKTAGDSQAVVPAKVIDDAASVDPNQSFDAEKISVANVPTNSLESPTASRGQKAIVDRQQESASVAQQAQESREEEQAQITTVVPEVLKTRRPGSVNRPVVLKSSNLTPTTADTPVTTERRFPTTTTTTTTSAPSTEAPRSRLRFKSRTDAAAVNNVVRPTEETSEAPVEVSSRRPLKDSSRRRQPGRRIQAVQEAPAVEDQPAPIQAEEPTRLPVRTRFPPRIATTQAAPVPEVAVTETARTQIVSQELASAPVQSIEAQSPVIIESQSERRAKDNFARQKSINDLYALTRLHQLAINTRVPNRKTDGAIKGTPPKIAAGFINSAEQTTRYSEDSVASSEATTLASAFPSVSSAESIPSTEHVPQTFAPTTTTSTTTTEAVQERGPGKQRNNRFRPRARVNHAEGPSSTTTEVAPSRAPATHPNRFGGRRRFSPSTVAPADAAPSAATATETEQRPQPVRQPTRNRFSGRTRPTTSTTEATESEHGSEAQSERPQAPRRRPNNFQGRRRLQQATTPQSEDAESSPPTTAASRPPKTSESERRRFNFGNPARNRPSGPGSGAERPRPIIRGGRTSTTEAPAVQDGQENPEPIVSEQVSVSESEVQAEKPQSNTDEHAPVVSVSSTTSSSVTSDVLVNKKGSAGVLGRLRNRSKPIVTSTTTVAPEHHAVERKPSRLSGILNRRKLASQPAPAAKEEAAHEEQDASLSPEHEELQRKGVVVQISSTVTESEEIGDNLEHESDHSSSTTHASILNRLKSQRKPGQIYRKAPTHSSE